MGKYDAKTLTIVLSMSFLAIVIVVAVYLILYRYYGGQSFCPPGQSMINGTCVQILCNNDSMCGTGKVCLQGICTTPTPVNRQLIQPVLPFMARDISPSYTCENMSYSSSHFSYTRTSEDCCLYDSNVSWEDNCPDPEKVNSFFYEGAEVVLYSNGELEYTSTCKVFACIDICPDFIACLGHTLYALSDGVLYKRTIWENGPMIATSAHNNVSCISSTFGSDFLWIQSGSSGTIIDVNGSTIETVAIDPNSIRKYGTDLITYGVLNLYFNTLTLYPSAEVSNGVKDFALGKNDQVCILDVGSKGFRIISIDGTCVVIQ